MKPSFLAATLSAVTALLPFAAQAHVSLATPQANAGSFYKAVLRVPHGCQGSATQAITVSIPEGVIAVKPQPKAGWQITTKESPYAHAAKLDGKAVTSGITQIQWKGNLPDSYYDEFVFYAYLTPTLGTGKKIYFPTVQTCEKGQADWTNTSGDASKGESAPSLELQAPAASSMPGMDHSMPAMMHMQH